MLRIHVPRDKKQFSPALQRWVTDRLNLNQSENVVRIEFDSVLLQTKAKLGFKRSLRVMFPLLPNVAWAVCDALILNAP